MRHLHSPLVFGRVQYTGKTEAGTRYQETGLGAVIIIADLSTLIPLLLIPLTYYGKGWTTWEAW
jgi:hypothetical protein